ncbi:MAG: type II toxin-antitoxin system HicB family antitoxin [Clostridia bacterium]|nr:type II toxin-antitoxin system HicB family antitoxin [Clostridia bacterium]
MKRVYPIVITPSGNNYVVFVPDFEMNTEGNSIEDALIMAREAIGLCGITLEDMGKNIPEPKTLKPDCTENDVVALIDIDFNEFRAKEENRCVRKNCTIPRWLEKEAEARNINFSAVLQEALKTQLGL